MNSNNDRSYETTHNTNKPAATVPDWLELVPSLLLPSPIEADRRQHKGGDRR